MNTKKTRKIIVIRSERNSFNSWSQRFNEDELHEAVLFAYRDWNHLTDYELSQQCFLIGYADIDEDGLYDSVDEIYFWGFATSTRKRDDIDNFLTVIVSQYAYYAYANVWDKTPVGFDTKEEAEKFLEEQKTIYCLNPSNDWDSDGGAIYSRKDAIAQYGEWANKF